MILYYLDLFGVAVFAVSGALVAGRKSLDLLGVFLIAGVTAIGGGTTRDVLLDRFPIFWMVDPMYLIVITAATLLTVAYVRFRPPPGNSLLVADAFGLAIFTVIGAQIAEAAGQPVFIIVLMGTMTGVVGGMLRDVLCARVPMILRRDIYATAAILGAVLYVVLQAIGVASMISVYVSMTSITILRLLAILKGLRLPIFKLPQQPY